MPPLYKWSDVFTSEKLEFVFYCKITYNLNFSYWPCEFCINGQMFLLPLKCHNLASLSSDFYKKMYLKFMLLKKKKLKKNYINLGKKKNRSIFT